ncbi:MAG: HEAT repeat domain-containing protein [Desulfobulbaceae bacterium]|nr:HEAT repeat domain-containing protein [Desulfobulbaceae bacterium]
MLNRNRQKRKVRSNELVSEQELIKVIADFLEMGHLENIIAMYKQQPSYYNLIDKLLADERFAVRLGVTVLMEELHRIQPDKSPLALPSLTRAIRHKRPLVRGEAANILDIIHSHEAIALVKTLTQDPSSQVREVALDIMEQDG